MGIEVRLVAIFGGHWYLVRGLRAFWNIEMFSNLI